MKKRSTFKVQRSMVGTIDQEKNPEKMKRPAPWPEPPSPVKCIKEDANEKLLLMKHLNGRIADLKAKASAEMEAVLLPYKAFLDALQNDKAALEKELTALMKKNKGVLFDGTDVVNLIHGSLIREKGDHVTIPKTALAACEEQGFDDVIKIVKSLDRDAIEKWSDAKLTLIGAERKTKEEFTYSLKAEVSRRDGGGK
ncbi:MAG: host-nuclease inhibitor Gam family protein [Deltaproteobacteria bacterium]|nr:host-nuclease inhibitor Gam family protein [Deltaproteobacteria bacterium]